MTPGHKASEPLLRAAVSDSFPASVNFLGQRTVSSRQVAKRSQFTGVQQNVITLAPASTQSLA